MGDPSDEVIVEVEKKKEAVTNGEAPDANGNTEEAKAGAPDANGNTEEAVESPRIMKTVDGIVAKLKNDTNLSASEKIDTLCLLVQRIVEENNALKGEIVSVGDQCEKQREAKEAIKSLNNAYKKQIDLVKEESKLRLEEEQAKRQAGMGGYTSTMNDISGLLETHTAQNSALKEQNADMAQRMGELVGETEKRDAYIDSKNHEAQLQIALLQHQVQKAQIEKAEIKADMTKDRLELAQELMLERERSRNLDDTVRILKEQADLYQVQMEELQAGAGNSTKSFQHFKTQIDKLTKAMGQLEKDTAQWRQKYEVSSGQVKKMNKASMERESEVGALKKKLDTMIKLNKTLSKERSELLEKCKTLDA